MRINANGVPSWVTALAGLIGLFSVIAGLAIMADPTIMGIDDTVVGRQWGGRNIGLGVALVLAVALRDARVYLAGFAAGLFRDIGDFVGRNVGARVRSTEYAGVWIGFSKLQLMLCSRLGLYQHFDTIRIVAGICTEVHHAQIQVFAHIELF